MDFYMYVHPRDTTFIRKGIVNINSQQGFFILNNHRLSNDQQRKNKSIFLAKQSFLPLISDYNQFFTFYYIILIFKLNYKFIMLQSNPHSIVANLSGPQKKGGHNLYSIVGSDKNGEFNTVKRFSEFQNLRNTLTARWPGCYIPSLPEKKFIGNQDLVILQMRKIGLDYFVSNLKDIPKIWYSQEIQLFLHKVGDSEKQLQKMKETNLTEILQRYKKQFPDYFNKEISKELNNDIIEFGQYLKKAKGLLQNLEKMTEQIYNSRKKYNEKFLNLVQNLIPEYETNCLEIYTTQNSFEQLIFTGPKKQKLLNFYEEFKKKTNNIIHVFGEIKKEKEEILSFEDLLKVKQYYTTQKQKSISKVKDLEIEKTKIHAGKQSLLSKIKKKTKEEQLKQNEDSIRKAEEQQKNLSLFCEIIILLLGETQIQKFKSARQRSYYSLLKTFFELEKQQCQLKRNFWSVLLKDNLEKQELDNFFERQRSPLKLKQQKSFEPTDVENSENDEQQQNDQKSMKINQQAQRQNIEKIKIQQQVQQIEVKEEDEDHVQCEQEKNAQNQEIQE